MKHNDIESENIETLKRALEQINKEMIGHGIKSPSASTTSYKKQEPVALPSYENRLYPKAKRYDPVRKTWK